MSNDQTRQQLAQRMSNAIGLPISSVNGLIADFSDDEVLRLVGLDEDTFKQESVVMVNKAQQREFAKIGQPPPETVAIPVKGAAPPPPPPPPAPAAQQPTATGPTGKKKLVIPMGGQSSETPPPPPPPPPAAPAPADPTPVVSATPPAPPPEDSTPAVSATPPKPKISVDVEEGPTESQQMAPPPAAGSAPKPKKLQINMKAAAENIASTDAAAKVMADAVASAPPPAPMPASDESTPTVKASPTADAVTPTPQASGIKAVEPEGRQSLNITPQEAELLEDEVQPTKRTADFSEEDEAQDISDAFTSIDDDSKSMSKQTLMLIIGGGVAGLLVIGMIGYLVITMVLGPKEPVIVKNPGPARPKNPGPVVPDKPKEFIGKWAWKNSKPFEESFENPYVLREKETPFTVEMWISFGEVDNVDSVSLTTVNDLFTIGMKKYRNRPVVYFDVPEAYTGRGGIKTIMPTSEGWIHLAGVYDPVESRTLSLFVNGNKMATRNCRKQVPLLVASIFILKGNVSGEAGHILIDDIRMSGSALYTDDFEPTRNMKTGPETRALLRMEQKKAGTAFEVQDVAQSELRPYIFTAGEWVEVDTESFKIAIDKTVEIEKEMFTWMERKWPAEKFEKFKTDWEKFPAEVKEKYRRSFEKSKKKRAGTQPDSP